MYPTKEVAGIVSAAVKTVYDLEVTPEVTYADAKFGDYATNIALRLAKELKKPPMEIATELSQAITHQNIESVAAAPPGFINITMRDDYWRGAVDGISQDYARSDSVKGKKVQVEFISANPTGPLTLGNARGAFIGDALSNVLDSQGYDVTREYYFNDAGTQITKLLESVKTEAGLIEVEERQYSGEYITKLASDFKSELETLSDKELKGLITQQIFKEYIRPDIDRMGIHFDVWFNETELIESGAFEETTKLLEEKGLLFDREGAKWANTGLGGDPRGERVFIKSNGDPAYFAPDVAYHVNIFGQRDFDVSIKELGPDHIAQFPSVKAMISLLFPDKEFKMVGHQQVRLIKDGREVKMSKRLGQFVTVGDLIEEVGADVARWFMLMRTSDTHMDFDLDLAKEQSQKNPFWYVMYAYVRINAIINQAKERSLEAGESIEKLEPTEKALVRQITRLPELVEEIAGNYEVHKLTFFGLESAKLFHDWYESVRVIDLPPEQAAQKLYLLGKLKTAMEAYFKLLGIKPREKM